MSEWSHLPNAKHIDWVIETVNTHQDLWYAARVATWATIRGPAYDAAYNAAYSAILSTCRRADYSYARIAAYGDDGPSSSRSAARDVILALVAYDDCDQYLGMSSEQLSMWAKLTEHLAAVLLLPMVIVREQIEKLEST